MSEQKKPTDGLVRSVVYTPNNFSPEWIKENSVEGREIPSAPRKMEYPPKNVRLYPTLRELKEIEEARRKGTIPRR